MAIKSESINLNRGTNPVQKDDYTHEKLVDMKVFTISETKQYVKEKNRYGALACLMSA